MEIWKNIKLKKGINFRSKTEFKNFDEKIDIIPIDKERLIMYLNNRVHFYNGASVITLDNDDILQYDKHFYDLIGKKSYDIIKEIFYICGLQIKIGAAKAATEKNELDILIDKLRTTYGNESKLNGNIEEFENFLELYSYIRSLSFYCKDRSRSLTVPKSHKENFGGRCTDLLSIKKLIIDDLPVYQASHMWESLLGVVNLRDLMIDNGIPPNPCIYDKKGQLNNKDQTKLFEYE